MRITNNMLVGNMVNYMGNNLNRLAKFQNQLATGKKIETPSDDPIVAARALKLRTDVAEISQYQRNVEDSQSWMEITESTLTQINDVYQRVRELAVQAANGTNSIDDTQKISEEIKQLRGHLIQTSNTTYAGRFLFSGFKTDTKLMNDDGTFNISVSSDENIEYEISVADRMNINVLGGNLFNMDKEATEGEVSQVIKDMDDFICALNGVQNADGEDCNISDTMGRMDEQINNLLRIRADVGARMNRLDLTSRRLDDNNTSFQELMSQNEDVDMAETIMKLKNEENVYKASLSGGARIIQPTLLDFLR